MGCLKKIFQIIILALAVVGFTSLGGQEWVMKYIEPYLPKQESKIDKANKIGDFSKISEEFEIDKTANAFGFKGVLAEHNASGQKLLVVNSGKKPILKEADIESPNLKETLRSISSKYTYQTVKLDNLEITGRGTMKAFGKKVPYATFTASIKNFPIGDVKGIISCIDLPDEDSRIFIAINEKNKYSQLVTKEFFKNVNPPIKQEN